MYRNQLFHQDKQFWFDKKLLNLVYMKKILNNLLIIFNIKCLSWIIFMLSYSITLWTELIFDLSRYALHTFSTYFK